MKESIYLIGQISIDAPITYEWRKNVRRSFAGNPEWEVIDPCNNGFNQTVLANAGKDIHRKVVYKTQGIELLVPKDYSYVARSTMGFCNMNQYDPNKAIIGTCFELAWYFQMQKSVIGIYDGNPEEDLHCNHPFVKSAVTTWVKNEWEACELALHYFQDAIVESPTFEEARELRKRLEKVSLGKIN